VQWFVYIVPCTVSRWQTKHAPDLDCLRRSKAKAETARSSRSCILPDQGELAKPRPINNVSEPRWEPADMKPALGPVVGIWCLASCEIGSCVKSPFPQGRLLKRSTRFYFGCRDKVLPKNSLRLQSKLKHLQAPSHSRSPAIKRLQSLHTRLMISNHRPSLHRYCIRLQNSNPSTTFHPLPSSSSRSDSEARTRRRALVVIQEKVRVPANESPSPHPWLGARKGLRPLNVTQCEMSNHGCMIVP
jgi:hypothetical protein